MQKFLLASTALVLSAGYAAAEVTVGGDGRLGVVYEENGDVETIDPGLDGLLGTEDDETIITPGGNEFSFNSRIRISFSASGETDGGLQFGGSIRADNAGTTDVSVVSDDDDADGFVATTEGGGVNGLAGSVFVSGAFGKLSMGDVDSGAQAAVGQVSGVGYTGLGDVNEISYIGNEDDETALYEYAFGDIGFFASIGQVATEGDSLAVGATFGFANVNFALGYEDVDGVGDHLVAGASAGFGDFTVKAVYGNFDSSLTETVVVDGVATEVDVDSQDQYAVSLDFATGPTVFTAFVSDSLGGDDDLNYGIGAAYDLGGGASLKGGIVHVGTEGDEADLAADFGITMSF